MLVGGWGVVSLEEKEREFLSQCNLLNNLKLLYMP